MFIYQIMPIQNGLSDYVETIAAKRYHNYLKEEERKRRRSEWTQHVIAALPAGKIDI